MEFYEIGTITINKKDFGVDIFKIRKKSFHTQYTKPFVDLSWLVASFMPVLRCRLFFNNLADKIRDHFGQHEIQGAERAVASGRADAMDGWGRLQGICNPTTTCDVQFV